MVKTMTNRRTPTGGGPGTNQHAVRGTSTRNATANVPAAARGHVRDTAEAALPRLHRQFSAKVVGGTFTDGYPATYHRIRERLERTPGHTIPAVLRRDPGNPHDPNAVQVLVDPGDGTPVPVGHVNAGVASRLAPHLDAGETWHAAVTAVPVHTSHDDRPGMDISYRQARHADDLLAEPPPTTPDDLLARAATDLGLDQNTVRSAAREVLGPPPPRGRTPRDTGQLWAWIVARHAPVEPPQ